MDAMTIREAAAAALAAHGAQVAAPDGRIFRITIEEKLMTQTETAPRTRFALADVVIVEDAVIGLIEQINGTPDEPSYLVRALRGSSWLVGPEALALVDDGQTITDMRGDLRQRAAGEPSLAPMFRVLNARQRAECYFRGPYGGVETLAGVDFALLPAATGAALTYTTRDARFELRAFVLDSGEWRVAEWKAGRRETTFAGSLAECAQYVASRLGVDSPTAAEELMSDVDEQQAAERAYAEQMTQISRWFTRHELDALPTLTADDVLAARAADERDAYAGR